MPRSASALEDEVLDALSIHGQLAQHDAGFVPRDGQQHMASAVAHALEHQEIGRAHV